MALPVTITGISTAVAPVGPFKRAAGDYAFAAIDTGAVGTVDAGLQGPGTSFIAQAQSFTNGGSSLVIPSVGIKISKTGTPTDNVYAEITNADPSGTVVATSNVVACSTITGTGFATATVITFTFPSPPTIAASATFSVILRRTATDASNYPKVATSSSSTYAGGSKYSLGGSTWTAQTASDIQIVVNTNITLTDAYYFFGRDGTTATTLQAFKSTAPDTSWASIATKTGFVTGIQHIAAYPVGNIIHIVITDGATTSINHKYQTFDCSTDTFVTAETINTALNTTNNAAANQYNTSVVVRSGGEVVVHYNAARITNRSQTAYRRRTGVNTWAAGVAVSATGVDCSNPIVVLGASDRLHFLWHNATNVQQRHLTSANVLGTAASTGATAVPLDVVTWDNAGTIRCVGLTASSAFRWASADNPTVTNAAVTLGSPVRGVDDNNVVYALYQSSTDSDLYTKSSSDNGATFGTAVSSLVGTVAAADANLSKNQQAYQRGGAFVFPYLVNDNGTLKYNEYAARITAHTLVANTSAIALSGIDTTLKKENPTTWNPDDKSAEITLSNNDKTATLSADAAAGFAGVRSIRKNANGVAGKYYAEFFINAPPGSGWRIGVSSLAQVNNTTIDVIQANRSGSTSFGSTGIGFTWSGTAVVNDVISIAWDTGAELVWLRRNTANWNNTAGADPATGIGGKNVSAAPATDYALWLLGTLTGDSVTLRTRLAEFTQAKPSGFTSWMGEALASVTHYTMPAVAGGFALTGVVAATGAVRRMPVPFAGAFALTGQPAGLELSCAAVKGSIVLTGLPTALRSVRKLTAAQGAVALTGIDATLTKSTAVTHYTMPATAGAFALSGKDAALTRLANKTLAVNSGSYVLTGIGVGLRASRVLAGATGSYVLTGATAALVARRKVAAAMGHYALSGMAIGFLPTRRLVAGASSYVLTGTDATLKLITGKFVSAQTGSYALTGTAVSFRRTYRVAADVGSYVLTGTTATLLYSSEPIEIGIGGGLRHRWLTARDGHADGAVIVVNVDLVAGRATGAGHSVAQAIVVGLRCVDGVVVGDATAGGAMRLSGISLRAGRAHGEINLSADELLILAEAA